MIILTGKYVDDRKQNKNFMFITSMYGAQI